jgi:hypothetical protein
MRDLTRQVCAGVVNLMRITRRLAPLSWDTKEAESLIVYSRCFSFVILRALRLENTLLAQIGGVRCEEEAMNRRCAHI